MSMNVFSHLASPEEVLHTDVEKNHSLKPVNEAEEPPPTLCDKVKRAIIVIVKICLILILLYFFICSLDLLSASFRLIAGKAAGKPEYVY